MSVTYLLNVGFKDFVMKLNKNNLAGKRKFSLKNPHDSFLNNELTKIRALTLVFPLLYP